MKLNKYLIVGVKKKWSRPTARLTHNAPSLQSHEIAIKLELDLPDALFDKPQLTASVTVPEDAVSAPIIDAGVVDNIGDVISKQLGVDLNITVVSEVES